MVGVPKGIGYMLTVGMIEVEAATKAGATA
jgi:hypothetical protein